MSFKATGPKTRPDRVRPPKNPDFVTSPLPSGWTASTSTNGHRPRSISNTSTDSSTSFHSAASQHDDNKKGHPDDAEPARFSPEEEATMISTSNSIKVAANTQFANADYSSAISTYDKALAELPIYLEYELAVLQSNIAACHLKLEQWKEALEACEAGLGGLEREMPTKKTPSSKTDKNKDKDTRTHDSHYSINHDSTPQDTSDSKIVELPSDATDAELAQHLTSLNISDARAASITRIRLKLLLRRARARTSLQPPSWSHLAGALEDYKTLSSPDYFSLLPASDQKTVRKALVELPPRVNEAKDKEVGEMMGKLKELGNGILKPFGLSTDMFKMVQDQKTGGWSMNFDQGNSGGGGGGGGGGAGSS